MTDQQRGDTVLPTHPALTPRIDQFRSQAVTFTDAFCPSPHCCPSRASFFSGQYPSQHGVWNNVLVHNTLSTGLNPGVRLWSEDLAAAGYDLHWSGKWHLSRDEGPADRGWTVHSLTAGPVPAGAATHDITWDRYRQLAGSELRGGRGEGQILRPGYGTYTHYGVNERPFDDQGQVDAAVRVLDGRVGGSRPWAMYVGTLGPHDPYFVPQRFLDMYDIRDIDLPQSFFDIMGDKPALYWKTRKMFDQLTPEEHRRAVLHYYAFCTYEDYLFGQVLDALDRTGQSDNTMVVYCSDHGDYTAEHGLWCKGLPCFRGAYHVPAIIRWPQAVQRPGRTVDAMVSLTDFAPTFLEAAGIDWVGESASARTADAGTASAGTASGGPADAGTRERFAGRSLVPFLRGQPVTDWRQECYTQSNGNELYGIQRAVFSKEWKFVYNGFDFEELYNLQEDPDETVNLFRRADESIEIRSRVRTEMQKIWQFAAHHDEKSINPYIMVGLAPFGPALAFQNATDDYQ